MKSNLEIREIAERNKSWPFAEARALRDRLDKSNSLSGGESQRINIATSIGSSLVGSMYILDEPSIGLHPRDTNNLIKILNKLRDIGNTVIIVEHDEEIIKSSDNIYNPGGISPGLKMRIKSISDDAFNLFETDLDYPKKFIADDTKSSLDIGVLGGIKFEIEGFIKQYNSLFDNLIVVITGGDSNFLSGKIKNTIFTNSNYIFKGLDYLIEFNK